MAAASDLSECPLVIAAGLYPKSTVSAKGSRIFLGSQDRTKELSSACNKQFKKSLKVILKEAVDSKDPFTKHTMTLGTQDYELTILGISDDYNGIFLCDKSDEFFDTYTLDKDEPALSSLPFLDGTLSTFLSRDEIYGHEFAKSKKGRAKSRRKLSVGTPITQVVMCNIIYNIYIINWWCFGCFFLFFF